MCYTSTSTTTPGDLLRRVAYRTSQRTTEHLQQFVDRHGRSPAQVPDLRPTVQWLGLVLTMMRLPAATTSPSSPSAKS